MLYYFKKGKNAIDTQKKICAVYGESAMTYQTCQKWFVNFCAGDFSLDNALWSSGPVEGDSNQIEILTESNQHHTMQEISNILKISKSIKLLVKIKNMSFILRKKTYRLFGQSNIINCSHHAIYYTPRGYLY